MLPFTSGKMKFICIVLCCSVFGLDHSLIQHFILLLFWAVFLFFTEAFCDSRTMQRLFLLSSVPELPCLYKVCLDIRNTETLEFFFGKNKRIFHEVKFD